MHLPTNPRLRLEIETLGGLVQSSSSSSSAAKGSYRADVPWGRLLGTDSSSLKLLYGLQIMEKVVDGTVSDSWIGTFWASGGYQRQ